MGKRMKLRVGEITVTGMDSQLSPTQAMSIWDFANPQLKDLVAYEPGKPIDEVARDLGMDPGEIVKLASNENPLGPSPKAVAAMIEVIRDAHIYPDGGGYRLRTAIAEKCGLERDNVILGNGSNEIIELIGHAFLQRGDNIVTAEHAFVVYKLMATLFGAETIEVPDPGFVHDLDAMAAAIDDRTKEVFVANPNNPTGTLVGMDAIERFLDKAPPHVVIGRTVYYRIESVRQWLAAQERQPDRIVRRRRRSL